MKKTYFFPKTILLSILYLFLSKGSFGQSPEKLSYQAVIRNTNNNLVSSQSIGMQVSILQGSTSGSIVFSEEHATTTNANGLVSIMIGTGNISTGSFSSIDWSNGPYFIKTETDITGGNNYTITGTQELLSVPYALHAKTVEIDSVNDADADPTNELQNLTFQNDSILISNGTGVALSSIGNGGKTHIILSGNISDNDAAIKITNELGSNTQFVLIQNTTNLTTIDLTGITELIDLKILNNTNLTSVNMSNLSTIYTSCDIGNNPMLNNINFNSLSTTGDTYLHNNNALPTLSFPSINYAQSISISSHPSLTSINLTTLNKIDFVDLSNNSALTSINLPNINSHIKSGINIVNNSSLTSINLPNIPSVDYFSISDNSLLTAININSMTNSAGFVFAINNNPALTSLDLSNLTLSANTNFEFKNNSAFTSLDLSGLTICQNLEIVNNSILSTLNVTNISTASLILINNNTNLSSLSIPNLNTVNSFSACNNNLSTITISGLTNLPQQQFLAFGNSLPSSSINNLLAFFVSLNPTSGYISINNQNPAAPPTGQGITDKNTLTNNGVNVFTD